MNLECAWFIGLMVVCFVFSWIAARYYDDYGFDSAQWQLAAHGSAVMAVVISWDRTGGELFSSLLSLLPQHGNEIAVLTAAVLTGLTVLIVTAAIPLATILCLTPNNSLGGIV